MPLERLVLEPGTRTLGELFQEREWAVAKIRRLRGCRAAVAEKEAARIERRLLIKQWTQASRSVAECQTTRAACRSGDHARYRSLTIYKYIGEGTFPAPVQRRIRSVRWKLANGELRSGERRYGSIGSTRRRGPTYEELSL